MSTRCFSCKAQIEFVPTRNKRLMPLDVPQLGLFDQPATDDLKGKMVIEGGVVRAATEEDVKAGLSLRVSHFATCPGAAAHRKPRGLHE